MGQLQPRPQPRALRGVPRSDHEVLDGAGPLPLGGPALSLPPREPVVPAAAEAAPAHLDSGHREPGDRGVGRPARLHVRAVPGAVRDRAAAVRVLPAGRGGGRPHRDARQPGLPDLRRDRRHDREGPRGRETFRLAHGPDAARTGRVVLAGGHALARGPAVRAEGPAAVTGHDELRRAAWPSTSSSPAHRTRSPRGSRASSASWASATCCWRRKSRAWTTPRPCAPSS